MIRKQQYVWRRKALPETWEHKERHWKRRYARIFNFMLKLVRLSKNRG